MLYSYFKKVNDPISSYTHFIGAIFSLFTGFLWLIYGLFNKSTILTLSSVLSFAVALVALYLASSFYHTVPHNNKRYTLYRKLDHSMIYVLIVGSYTPFIIAYTPNAITVVIFMWLLALSGIILKLCWLQAPRWFSTSLYILLGWSIIFMPSMFSIMPIGCIVLLALGGVAYTLGGIIYIIKKPNLSLNWSFHEVFHIFIMIGSLFHILAISFYVI